MAYVTTTELKNGDVVLAHGAKLKLRGRVNHGPDKAHPGGGDIITFHVDMIDNQNGNIPLHWLTAENPRDRYTIQGNNYAIWNRE
jgi:hypothetical protein